MSLIYEPTQRGKAVKTTDDSPWLDQDKAERFMRVHIRRHWDRERKVRFAKQLWEGLDDYARLDAYRDALDNLREMEGRYKAVRAQLNAMISDHSANKGVTGAGGVP